jgi:secreted Zn-dependent insulinase-like peptidase
VCVCVCVCVYERYLYLPRHLLGENEWEKYLSRHGGDSNAATDNDCTTFSFEVHHKYLLPALEMFSGFFATPLMLQVRERESVCAK